MDEDIKQQIEKAFTYHPPTGEQIPKYNTLRAAAKTLAEMIADFCPPSRERSLALTKLEETVMWANASIARNTCQHGEAQAVEDK
jgi:hypothetical protein